MDLVHEFTFRVVSDAATEIGEVDAGVRSHHVLPGIVIEGDRLTASGVGAGSDWYLQMRDGFGRIDVRAQVLSDDGARLLVAYQGWVEPTEILLQAVKARASTRFQDQLIRTIWQLECGDERYSWVNRTLFVGEGRLLPGSAPGQLGMEHRVFRLV